MVVAIKAMVQTTHRTCCPFQGKLFLVVVDARSKWIKALVVPSSSSAVTIDALLTMFAQHGILNSIVSDNGSSFTSSEFQNFWKMNGIKHDTSAPYKPASNDQAECAVQIIKNGLSRVKEGSIQSHLARMLLNYQNQTTSNHLSLTCQASDGS